MPAVLKRFLQFLSLWKTSLPKAKNNNNNNANSTLTSNNIKRTV